METHALAFHLRDAAVDQVLFHLEIGNAIAQQSAGAAFALIDVDHVTGARQLRAAARPAGPEPMMATDLPVLLAAGCGTI